MMRPILSRIVDHFERKLRVPMDYMRYVVRVHPAVFMKFGKIQGPANYRKYLALDAFQIAQIAANRAMDCGTCVQIAVNMALDGGMDREMVRVAALGSPAQIRASLDPRLADIWEFSNAVMRDAPEQDELRERVKARLGDQAFCELALAVTMAGTFPTMKRALGYAISCSKITVDV